MILGELLNVKPPIKLAPFNKLRREIRENLLSIMTLIFETYFYLVFETVVNLAIKIVEIFIQSRLTFN